VDDSGPLPPGLIERFAPQQRTDYVALLNEWAVGRGPPPVTSTLTTRRLSRPHWPTRHLSRPH